MPDEPIPGASGSQELEAGLSNEQELPIETLRQGAADLTREFVDTFYNLHEYQRALKLREQVKRVGKLEYDFEEEPVRFVFGGKEYSVNIRMLDGRTTIIELKRREDKSTDNDERQRGFWEEELWIRSSGEGINTNPIIRFFRHGIDPDSGIPFSPANTPAVLERTKGVLNDLKAGLPSNTTAASAPTQL